MLVYHRVSIDCDTFFAYICFEETSSEAGLKDSQRSSKHTFHITLLYYIANLRYPAKKKSLLVNVDIPIDTKRLVRISLYPCKIDLDNYIIIL